LLGHGLRTVPLRSDRRSPRPTKRRPAVSAVAGSGDPATTKAGALAPGSRLNDPPARRNLGFASPRESGMGRHRHFPIRTFVERIPSWWDGQVACATVPEEERRPMRGFPFAPNSLWRRPGVMAVAVLLSWLSAAPAQGPAADPVEGLRQALPI